MFLPLWDDEKQDSPTLGAYHDSGLFKRFNEDATSRCYDDEEA